MRYLLQEKISITYNASSKARDDVAYFVSTYVGSEGEGYKVVGHNDKSKVKGYFGKLYAGLRSIYSVLLTLHRNDILLVQSSFKVLKQIDRIKKIKGFKVIYLVHDLDSLRDEFDNETANLKMIEELNRQEVVICHNSSMIKELKRRGCKTRLISLGIFDYYVDFSGLTRPYLSQISIAFAGNLSPRKTGFLYKLDDDVLPYTLNVYGKKEKEFKHLSYKGCFEAEKLPEILEGQYGLIWEGQDYSYDMSKHPYIMFNNPHKASLYIVSGLPIIIWEGAALAGLVKERKIGLTIGNLEELKEKVTSVSEAEYIEMQKNLFDLRDELTHGKHIHEAIKKAEELLNG